MIFNPLYKEFKSIIGAVPSANVFNLRVKGNFDSVVLLLRKDGHSVPDRYTLNKLDEFFSIQLSLQAGLYFYCYELSNGQFIGKSNNFDAIITSNPQEYQLTVYDNNYKTPEWFMGGIIYQIFPDRFYRGNTEKVIEDYKILRNDWGAMPYFLPNSEGEVLNNDFFGGDLKGISSKIDYLASLGVTVIYLNPIFKAYSNHRYDTGDFMQIDPLLGDLGDFKDLVNKASSAGIKIVLDGVFNHTGSDSIYFNKNSRYESIGAYQSNNSPYYDWFKFIKYPNEYESWWGIKTLPATNKAEGGFKEFITGKDGVIEFYTKLGIGGWRLDVVDELPSHFVKDIRKATKGVNPESIVIGEVWEDASNKISYGERREYFQGKELDSVMNYPLKNAIINFVKNGDEKSLIQVVQEQIDHYPKCVIHSLMNILATHDTFRLLSAISPENVNGKTKKELSEMMISDNLYAECIFKLKCATILQYFLYGVPSIYYGDEVGMQGYTDPLNRKCFPWGNEDLKILDWYKKLGKIRREYSVFKDGDYQTVYCNNGAFVFKRVNKNQEVLIAVNVGDEDVFLEFQGTIFELLTNTEFSNEYLLNKNSFGVFVCKND